LTCTENPGEAALRAEADLLRRQNAVLRHLVDLVVSADTWDESVYRCRPADDWLLVHRSSWAAIRAAVDRVDSWRPWEAPPSPPVPPQEGDPHVRA
jgi:hypothetical protein